MDKAPGECEARGLTKEPLGEVWVGQAGRVWLALNPKLVAKAWQEWRSLA